MKFGISIINRIYFPRRIALRFRKPAARVLMAVFALFLLSACGALPKPASAGDQPPTPGVGWIVPTATVASPSSQQDPDDMLRTDDQGAVEITAFPISLGPPSSEEAIFAISMNTHSVDLSMDLATLSHLETDLGDRVAAISWSGGSGHHVQGELIFPGTNQSGGALFEGASAITLTILSVDAPERTFYWDLPSN